MMKQFKKSALVTTAAFLLCLTAASGTLTLPSVPSITIDEEAEPTPSPKKPEIQPMSDGDEADSKSKTQ